MASATEPTPPDQLDGVAHPRESTALFGHEEGVRQFLKVWQTGKLHHAWLLRGKTGIGKATLAYHFAKVVLSGTDATSEGALPGADFYQNDRNAQLVANEAHPNLLVLRRTWNTRTKKFGAQITVDNVRELQRFLGNTSGMGTWRVVIIDRADDLNINAANALLKMLEEPPAFCLFLLVSSEAGRLPTTIRSRCRELRLETLPPDRLKDCLHHIAEQCGLDLPTGEDLPLLLELSGGSVRVALEFSGGRSLEDYRDIEALLDLLPRVDPQTTIALAERLAPQKNEKDYDSFISLLSTQMAARIRRLVKAGGGDKRALAQWSELWETITIKKYETDLLNLDRAGYIVDLFASIEKVAKSAGGLK